MDTPEQKQKIESQW